MTLGETVSVLLSTLAAVRVAHARGIVHRDLKPENIFLSSGEGGPSPEVKVLDFGLAKPAVADPHATSLSRTGSLMGTPHYMAPEQAYGEKDVDVRADVWALGVIVYECLSGATPFPGDNYGQIFRRISERSFTPLRQVAPDAPAEVEALVDRMLSHERSSRPTADAVYDALASLAAGDVLEPRRSAPPASRIPVAAPELAAATTLHDPPTRRRPRVATRPALVVAGTLAGAVVAVALAARPDRNGPPLSVDGPGGGPTPETPAVISAMPTPSSQAAGALADDAAVAPRVEPPPASASASPRVAPAPAPKARPDPLVAASSRRPGDAGDWLNGGRF
jgi:eukaryotic-like serine/threonine-protein kinase